KIPVPTHHCKSYEHAEDYEEVKAAILAKYEITQDIYRQRFRALEVYPGETPRELYVRLKELFSKWVRPEQKSVKEISEIMILEQFLRMVNTEMEVWIKERNPKTAEEAAQLAEVFISARRSKGPCSFSRDQHFSRKSVGDDRGLGHSSGRNPRRRERMW
uniref:SCAN box domain-containing protein n=1 Tax=Pygocentrus nattereri TaxID=42514 RepID=A0AAR2LCB5_PYGNA